MMALMCLWYVELVDLGLETYSKYSIMARKNGWKMSHPLSETTGDGKGRETDRERSVYETERENEYE